MIDVKEPVLVLAPTGRDAVLISEALQHARFACEICADLEEFASKLHESSAGLLAQEALSGSSSNILARALREQPAWSDIPLLLITHRSAEADLKKLTDHDMNLTLLERPLSIQALVTTVGSAVRQRRRQYELRDRLAEQQRTEERLRQTQRLESLGILAGGIAHDFNNLLTGILGNVSLALDSEPAMSPRRGFLKDAIQASERAADLTRQLLAYSGKGRFTVQAVDLSQLVRDINALIQLSIPKNVQVMLHLEEALPAIEADPAQLQQVIMNLIINGAEAIGPEKAGLVVVVTGLMQADGTYLRTALGADGASPGDYVFIEVRDTGCGIDELTLSKIFDPFFTTKFMGRGLGLAAVLGIVSGHDGALKVESTPGRGTCFRVLFPAAREAGARAQGRSARGNLAGAGTVLIIDDEEIVRKIARNTLESWGYRVLLAENGQIGVDLFAQYASEIALVLLDLTMPVMNGEETFHRLRRIRPDVRVILTSGYDEAEAIGRFAGAGLAGFMQKPYTASQLAECVKRVMESKPLPAAGGQDGWSPQHSIRV